MTLTVGEVIEALWWQPCWIVLGGAVTIMAAALVAVCAVVMLAESREHHGRREYR